MKAVSAREVASWLIDHDSARSLATSEGIPDIFGSYTRIFPPVDVYRNSPEGSEIDGQITWREVAEARGKKMHARVQFKPISVPMDEEVGDSGWFLYDVGQGEMRWQTFLALAPLMMNPPSAATIFMAYFVDLEETESIHADLWTIDLPPEAYLNLSRRSYRIFESTLDELLSAGGDDWPAPVIGFGPQIVWDEAQTWCIAVDIDSTTAVVGSTHQLAAAIARLSDVESMPVDFNTPLSWDADDINT